MWGIVVDLTIRVVESGVIKRRVVEYFTQKPLVYGISPLKYNPNGTKYNERSRADASR